MAGIEHATNVPVGKPLWRRLRAADMAMFYEICEAIEHADYDFVLKPALPHGVAGNSGPR